MSAASTVTADKLSSGSPLVKSVESGISPKLVMPGLVPGIHVLVALE
jgi:hypothetical protein